jgi:adenosylhomocysteine nucleosidase
LKYPVCDENANMKSTDLLIIASVAILVVLACSFIAAGSSEDKEQDQARIGIIGAMEEEVVILKNGMDLDRIETRCGMDFYIGSIEGVDVVVVQCGMGKVNAGICAQTLINIFHVTSVINTGVAGSLSDELDIGDYVVSTDAVQHDFDVSPIGFEKGEIPYTGLYSFKADDYLRSLAVEALKKCVDSDIFEGRICTGDQFISTSEQKDKIVSDFGGYCCEMEGGAIAQVCYLNEVPFVIIRVMSDKADGSGPSDYEEFKEGAAAESAQAVKFMIESYGNIQG